MGQQGIKDIIISRTIKLKRIKIIFAGICLISLSVLIISKSSTTITSPSNLSRLTSTSIKESFNANANRELSSNGPVNQDGQPIMHTFFDPVPGGCCGATLSAHQNLLNAWKDTWTSVGWDTRILTTEDAKLHPKFDKLERILETLHVDPYNKRCFYRWLAMAALSDGVDGNGGGWMSDYDTFPLEINVADGLYLPKGGRFTSFEFSVPSLISASKDEWNRLVDLFLDTLPIHKGYKTDMWVLDTIRVMYGEKAGVFKVYHDEVVQGFRYRKQKNDGRAVTCREVDGKKAVHLSHQSTDNAIQNGVFPLDDIANLHGLDGALEHRGEAAVAFLRDWRQQCRGEGTDVVVEEEK